PICAPRHAARQRPPGDRFAQAVQGRRSSASSGARSTRSFVAIATATVATVATLNAVLSGSVAVVATVAVAVSQSRSAIAAPQQRRIDPDQLALAVVGFADSTGFGEFRQSHIQASPAAYRVRPAILNRP